MAFTTLIETQSVYDRLADRDTAVIDCRFKLDDPEWGERAYEAAHVPGAVYAHLARDLAGAKTGTNGRHPLPEPAVFAAALGRWGIDQNVQVVIYDQDVAMYAGRLWWMLRWMGHERVAVLNGGFAKWTAEGRPTRGGREVRTPRVFHGTPRHELVATLGEVAAADRQRVRLVDARSPERFRGENETIDKAAGHIPGASNHFFKSNIDAAGTFLPAEVLRENFLKTFAGARPEDVICYCGSGVTACNNLLAMEHAGLRGAKLYPGSWSEWSADPARGIER
jgi:thiosulfate/3-mercaptopyruvate sulfurtransferase